MAAYDYLAVEENGRKKQGVLQAESERQARQLLRDQGLLPIQVSVAKLKSDAHWLSLKWLRFKSVSAKQLALFTRQFATLIASGLPLEETLLAVAEQQTHDRVKSLIMSVRAKVMEGHALAVSCRCYPDSFPPLYCAMIAAGEASGHLGDVLLLLADYVEKQWQIKQKITMALIYPSIIVATAIAIVAFLLEYVVPKMIAVYHHMDQTLPMLTQILLAVSSSLQRFGLLIVVSLIVIISLLLKTMKTHIAFKIKVHTLMLRIPFIGTMIKIMNTTRFLRALAILMSSGINLLESLNMSVPLITNLPMRTAVLTAIDRMREGSHLHDALKQTEFFLPMSLHLIASGEASGQLDQLLERAASHQENDVSRFIELSLALFEPIMILVMGLVVLFIVLAVLLPIFDMNQMAM